MFAPVGIWSVALEPGKDVEVKPPTHIQILNASLGEKIVDANGRSVVQLVYAAPERSADETDDEEEEEPSTEIKITVLTALTAGKTESTVVNLTLEGDEEYILKVTGKNTVYLTGNYVERIPDFDQDPSDDEFDDDSEAGYDLRDISSDVEMHPDDLDEESDASRFEEVKDEEPPKAQKRALEEAGEKKSKKQKGTDGKPLPVEADKQKSEKKEKKEKKVEKDEQKTEKKEGGKEEKKAVEKSTPSGVKYKDAKVGTGPQAKKGSTVLVRYKGRLANGKIFDQNIKGKPFTFHLGKGEVIKGWDEGIAGMQPGGERVLTIPPALAYGKKGVDGIPPNSTLTFEVKLLEIK